MKKNENGLTMLALIITIIILLILAAVTIAFTTGDNGILKRTKDAKSSTEAASLKEEIEIEVEEAFDFNTNQYDFDKIKNNLSGYECEEIDNGNTLKVTKNGTTFLISKGDGKVTQVTDESSIAGSSDSNGSGSSSSSSESQYTNKKISELSQDEIVGKSVYISDSNEKNWIVLYKNGSTVVLGCNISNGVECEVGESKPWWPQEDADAYLETDLSECASLVRSFNSSDSMKIDRLSEISASEKIDLYKANSKYLIAGDHISGPDCDGVYYINADGTKGSYMVWVQNDTTSWIKEWSDSMDFGLRPVFELKSNAYIKSGDGSSNNPFVLDI